jgi:hypothetical protein
MSIPRIPQSTFASAPRFLVGQDERGNWIAMDAEKREGGIFVSREAALKYAAAETGHGAGRVVATQKRLDLWS